MVVVVKVSEGILLILSIISFKPKEKEHFPHQANVSRDDLGRQVLIYSGNPWGKFSNSIFALSLKFLYSDHDTLSNFFWYFP